MFCFGNLQRYVVGCWLPKDAASWPSNCDGPPRFQRKYAVHRSQQRRQHNTRCKALWVQGTAAGRGVQPTIVVQPPALDPVARQQLQGPPMAMMVVLLVTQALALLGAVTGGVLARKRRLELESLNARLRQINSELRRQREQAEDQRLHASLQSEEEEDEASSSALPGAAAASSSSASSSSPSASSDSARSAEEEEAAAAAQQEQQQQQQYRSVLEAALSAPAAAHPSESYGPGGSSLAGARRRLAECIRCAREVVGPSPLLAVALLDEAQALAKEIQDRRAERAVLRAKARTLRQLEDLAGAMVCLQQSLQLSAELQEWSGDADTLGEIADLYVDLGDMEAAGEYYDRCIRAIQDEAPSALSSTWDMA